MVCRFTTPRDSTREREREREVHCPNKNQSFHLKIQPVAVGAYPKVSVWFLGQVHIYVIKNQTNTGASAPAVTGSVFKPIFGLFLGTVWRERVGERECYVVTVV